ncbi:HopJ type III effector protein [Escherichia coli]|nr:HopJ type III effector protein [Escherichia coli]
MLNNLDKEATLACFGRFYREDVLQHPENSDHQNIRNFMVTGWEGIKFEASALTAK